MSVPRASGNAVMDKAPEVEGIKAPPRHVDIIIPCWNNVYYSKQAIKSLLTHTDQEKTPFCLILINNGSEDETFSYLEGLKMSSNVRIRVIHNEKNEGWVGAINQGLKHCCPDHQYVLLQNNDVLFVQDNWLERLVSGIEMKPWLAGAGPVSNAVLGEQNIAKNNPSRSFQEVPWIIGFSMLLKRDMVERLIEKDGYFMDPIFNPGGCDEIDVCYRLNQDGYRFLIDRNVYLHHFCSKSLSKITNDLDGFHQEKMRLLMNKWGEQEIAKFMGAIQPRTIISIPTVGQIDSKFFYMFHTLNRPAGTGMDVEARSLPDIARNKLAERAIQYGYDYIFFLDDDMLFEDQNLMTRMVQQLEARPDADIIAPAAFMRNPPYYPCVFRYSDDMPYFNVVADKNQGIVEVDGITCAATLVRTSLFKRMEKPWFEWLQYGKDRLGEDLSFCHKARQLGRKILFDSDREVYHMSDRQIVGRKVYEQHNNTKPERFKIVYDGMKGSNVVVPK